MNPVHSELRFEPAGPNLTGNIGQAQFLIVFGFGCDTLVVFCARLEAGGFNLTVMIIDRVNLSKSWKTAIFVIKPTVKYGRSMIAIICGCALCDRRR